VIARLFVNQELYPLTYVSGARYRAEFNEKQFVRFPQFLRPEGFGVLLEELRRLHLVKVRRELNMAGSEYTPRRMSTLGGLDVAHYSSIIPLLYGDPSLIEFLSGIAGEPVFEVPDQKENYVCNFLHEVGDCHGGHVDSYAFAFNIIVEAPPPEKGGLLEYSPHSTHVEDLDTSKAIRVHLSPSDCYFLRSDKVAHRVSKLTAVAQRSIINMAYANASTLNEQSYSSSALYSSVYVTRHTLQLAQEAATATDTPQPSSRKP